MGMLSPKMQRIRAASYIRINDGQLLGIAEKAKYDSRKCGYLYKRSSQDYNRWQRRWFRLYQVYRCNKKVTKSIYSVAAHISF